MAITNPALVQQGAALVGLGLQQDTAEPAPRAPREDPLSWFMTQSPAEHRQRTDTVPIEPFPTAVLPTTTLPTVAPPAATLPPVVPASAPPASAFPEPAVATEAPGFARSWDSQQASPIHTPPPVPDWSGPSQQLPPAPQHSIYAVAPQQNVFPVIHDVPDFTQMRYIPPAADLFSTLPVEESTASIASIWDMPHQHPQHPLPQPPPQPSVPLVESVPVHGTEMAARVGTQVILMGDILPQLRRLARQIIKERMAELPEEERATVPQAEIEQFINMFAAQHYSEMLQAQIELALVYNDYYMSQDRDSRNRLNSRMSEEFNRVEIPDMLEEFNVENVAALRRYLEEHLGSSLEREQRLWIRQAIVREWMSMTMQRATGDATHHEMLEFYERNQAMFTSATRARWQEMVVHFSNHETEREAWEKIVWMGNQVVQGAPFEKIAKYNSDGFTASNGGTWDWVRKGNLASAELEQAIFSQPVGHLSPDVIRTANGLHIIRVLEREESRITPFVEAQVTIRERIRAQRARQHHDEYFADLRRRFQTQILRDRIDFDVNTARTASVR